MTLIACNLLGERVPVRVVRVNRGRKTAAIAHPTIPDRTLTIPTSMLVW